MIPQTRSYNANVINKMDMFFRQKAEIFVNILALGREKHIQISQINYGILGKFDNSV